MYGTGKCAAFGIADSLTVDTVKSGKRNCVRLTREDLVPGLHRIPVDTLIDDRSTNASDGTIIRIERLLLQRLRRDSIKRYLQKAIGRSLKTHEVYWGSEMLLYEEPKSVKEWQFRVPTSLHSLLGDCELYVKAASFGHSQFWGDRKNHDFEETKDRRFLYHQLGIGQVGMDWRGRRRVRSKRQMEIKSVPKQLAQDFRRQIKRHDQVSPKSGWQKPGHPLAKSLVVLVPKDRPDLMAWSYVLEKLQPLFGDRFVEPTRMSITFFA